jgi:hypothetical protein
MTYQGLLQYVVQYVEYPSEINTKIRILLIVLCALFLVLYVASKMQFPMGYSSVEEYLRAHSVYWVALGATAFSIWLVERIRGRRNR